MYLLSALKLMFDFEQKKTVFKYGLGVSVLSMDWEGSY